VRRDIKRKGLAFAFISKDSTRYAEEKKRRREKKRHRASRFHSFEGSRAWEKKAIVNSLCLWESHYAITGDGGGEKGGGGERRGTHDWPAALCPCRRKFCTTGRKGGGEKGGEMKEGTRLRSVFHPKEKPELCRLARGGKKKEKEGRELTW